MWTPRRLLASSALALNLWLAPLALAQAPIDISHELISHPALLPNAAGEYGQSWLVGRNSNGLLVGGFPLTTPDLPEGSFFVLPPTTPGGPATARLFTAGPACTWTQVQDVNRHGAMVGWCYTRTPSLETVEGFYRSESGRITRLHPPGARLSEAHSVNDNHLVVGWYEDQAGVGHGYRWHRGTGQFTTVDAPFPGVFFTIPLAVTNADHIGVHFLTATGGGIALLRQGQWSTLTAPGIGFNGLEDLGEDGRVLLLGRVGEGVLQSLLWEQGVVTQLVWPTRQVRFTHARAFSGDLVVGHVDWDLPLPPDTPPTAADTIFQGFVAKLDALRGEVVTPPPPGSVARASSARMAQASADGGAAPAPPPRCPDDAREPGAVQGRLAQSWVLCARVR